MLHCGSFDFADESANSSALCVAGVIAAELHCSSFQLRAEKATRGISFDQNRVVPISLRMVEIVAL